MCPHTVFCNLFSKSNSLEEDENIVNYQVRQQNYFRRDNYCSLFRKALYKFKVLLFLVAMVPFKDSTCLCRSRLLKFGVNIRISFIRISFIGQVVCTNKEFDLVKCLSVLTQNIHSNTIQYRTTKLLLKKMWGNVPLFRIIIINTWYVMIESWTLLGDL